MTDKKGEKMQKMRNEMKSAFDEKKGFTLIELLVVIAIIAILATVVIINVTGARAKAEKAKMASDMAVVAKIASACQSFGGTIKTYIPSADICDKNNIADETERSAATGKYPPHSSFVLTGSLFDEGTITITYTKTRETLTVSTKGVGSSWVAAPPLPLMCTQNGSGTAHLIVANPGFTATLTCNRPPSSITWSSPTGLTLSACQSGSLTCSGTRQDSYVTLTALVDGNNFSWVIAYRP